MRRRRPLILISAVAAGAFTLLATGCGGGASPGVASIASSTTAGSTATTTSTTQGGSGSGDKSFNVPRGGRGHFSIAMNVGNAAQGAKFSACMRKHGVSNFPDPNGQGVITFGSGTGIDPSSPTFQSARSACQKLLPTGGRPTPQQQAKAQAQLLAFSTCMRAHGIQDFPDPSNGGLQIRARPGSDLGPNNAQFRAAQQACQGNLPRLKAAGVTSSGSK